MSVCRWDLRQIGRKRSSPYNWHGDKSCTPLEAVKRREIAFLLRREYRFIKLQPLSCPGAGGMNSRNQSFSSYTSILGDIWLWVGVPWASSALVVPLPLSLSFVEEFQSRFVPVISERFGLTIFRLFGLRTCAEELAAEIKPIKRWGFHHSRLNVTNFAFGLTAAP